jgi:hypothetical protein
MRWTRQRRARAGIAGQALMACERTKRARTTDAIRGRRSRVVLAPVAGAKSAEASRPTGSDKTLSADDGGNLEFARRGEHEGNR